MISARAGTARPQRTTTWRISHCGLRAFGRRCRGDFIELLHVKPACVRGWAASAGRISSTCWAIACKIHGAVQAAGSIVGRRVSVSINPRRSRSIKGGRRAGIRPRTATSIAMEVRKQCVANPLRDSRAGARWWIALGLHHRAGWWLWTPPLLSRPLLKLIVASAGPASMKAGTRPCYSSRHAYPEECPSHTD
jgi:hypothetical protein